MVLILQKKRGATQRMFIHSYGIKENPSLRVASLLIGLSLPFMNCLHTAAQKHIKEKGNNELTRNQMNAQYTRIVV